MIIFFGVSPWQAPLLFRFYGESLFSGLYVSAAKTIRIIAESG